MKTQIITLQTFRNGRLSLPPQELGQRTPQEAAHDTRQALRIIARVSPLGLNGLAAVITSRPFPCARPTNRIVIC